MSKWASEFITKDDKLQLTSRCVTSGKQTTAALNLLQALEHVLPVIKEKAQKVQTLVQEHDIIATVPSDDAVFVELHANLKARADQVHNVINILQFKLYEDKDEDMEGV